MSYRTERQRALGLGAAKTGAGHWWSQRVTAVALVPLVLLFIFPFARRLGDGYEAVRATYANPFNAVVAVLLILVVFQHAQQGLQVVIEDYVHGTALRTALLLANTLITWAFALAGIFAVAKIAFTA